MTAGAPKPCSLDDHCIAGHGHEGACRFPSRTVVHRCPVGDDAYAPCCGRPVFELPRHERITTDPEAVTCWTSGDPRLSARPEADR